jgi:uncharacterized protein YyaL (SSP411 family)
VRWLPSAAVLCAQCLMANRLALEPSPYLLQHKDNPVDWHPWGEAAFARARAEDKAIFLSIGYSTCHWCHVMEHESFESQAVADVLNQNFISIKVDREERPDVDRVYMTFVQATTGSGGWPMSVWLTPSLEPFYGGTYYPPTSRWGRPGFVEVLTEIARVWREERDKVVKSAASIVSRLRSVRSSAAADSVPGVDSLQQTVQAFGSSFDRRRGGFGGAPKFPRPSELLFLLREHARTGDEDARDMALTTLRAMALGGMRDHLGGGFHRYSVDAEWRVPHFEKMLYDQAQLVLAYLEAAQVSGDLVYLDVAVDTLEYVRRDMTDADGGYYSAEDADSVPPERASEPNPHRMEGAFYIWADAEIADVLGADADVFRRRYGVKADGNAPADPQQEFVGKNLLYTAQSIDQIASETGRTNEDVERILDRAREALLERRAVRPRPHLDDKILTAWNGLMIGAFARAARMVMPRAAAGLDDRRYRDSASRAARFVRDRLWDEPTRTLKRRYRSGEAGIDAYAEDYAFLVFGLLELFQADGDPAWLQWAMLLQQRQDELFRDTAEGGWFSTSGRDTTVLLRMKDDYDGAEPAASSVSVHNLLTLSHLATDTPGFDRMQAIDAIERTLKWSGARAEQHGRAIPMMMAALSAYHAGVSQLVLVGSERDTRALSRAAIERYSPFTLVVPIVPQHRDELSRLLPWTDAMVSEGSGATAYLCRDFACHLPATTPEALRGQLAAMR